MTFGYSKGKTLELILADEWFGHAESECFSTTNSLIQRILIALNCLMFFQLQMLLHIKYPLEPIRYMDQYRYRLGLIRITEHRQ